MKNMKTQRATSIEYFDPESDSGATKCYHFLWLFLYRCNPGVISDLMKVSGVCLFVSRMMSLIVLSATTNVDGTLIGADQGDKYNKVAMVVLQQGAIRQSILREGYGRV